MAEQKKESLLQRLGESQVWKSIIRSGVPRNRRQRMYAVLGNEINETKVLTCTGAFRMYPALKME